MPGTVISSSLQTQLARFAPVFQTTADGVPTFWVRPSDIRDVLSLLRSHSSERFSTLYDICAIDERARRNPAEQPPCDFSVVYHLLSLENNADIRVKVPLNGEYPSLPTVSDIWPNANWYEREVWDMFGIRFEGHPFLRRILNPPGWVGHPLRKEHPARATELEGYELPEDRHEAEEELLKARPEEFGLLEQRDGAEYTILNFGPHHPGTHGLLRIILQLSGETIEDSVVDIGWHHRGAEKMAERQTFHTFIPYTDRIDYLSGVLNNLPYVLSVEKLCGIEVPERAQVIRVMMCELSRIANHLVWFGTFGADVGALSPVFFTFTDRERVFDIVEAVCGGRMHPSWFRIGGVASDLPNGWKELIDDFLEYMPARIDEYEAMVVRNRIFRQRTKGVGVYTKQLAMDWGVTGPNLRSTGINYDLRKRRPYSGYDQFEFDVPLADEGDSYARCVVRIEEMRQSLRIVRQAAENMPAGSYKSEHPLAMPPRKEDTMVAIETLINHFLSVSWGQPVPAGEAEVLTEGAKGAYSYYVVSDGGNSPYRCHIRTPSFAHMQSLPIVCKGLLVSDLITILGSIDYVLADVDR